MLGWRLENGQQIEARVLVTLYEARGDFQLNVEAARRGGIGNLYEQFLRLKDKLASEGLFASAAKRPLPAFPRRIGIVTSPQAAALRDVLSTLATPRPTGVASCSTRRRCRATGRPRKSPTPFALPASVANASC
jgi:exodeoxyribonuclease VII large subunit